MALARHRGPLRDVRGASTLRSVAWLAGALLVFAVAFQLLERLAGPAEPAEPLAAVEAATPRELPRPRVRQPTADTVVVEIDGLLSNTITLDPGEGDAARLAACIERGIERSLSDGAAAEPPPGGWSARRALQGRLQQEMLQVQQECLSSEILQSDGFPPVRDLDADPREPPRVD